MDEQVIGFPKEADKGVPVKKPGRKHGFSDASYYIWRSKYRGRGDLGCEASEGAGYRERAPEEVASRGDAGESGHARSAWKKTLTTPALASWYGGCRREVCRSGGAFRSS